MWQRELAGTSIMVPLDGSELAERALPVAEQVATAVHGELVLVRITSPVNIVPLAPGGMTSEQSAEPIAEARTREAHTYLESVALPLRERGLQVQVVTHAGMAAPAILGLLASFHVGLVVMTTHGRTGMALFAIGSVADQVVRASHVPVLLVRPLISDQPCERLERAVVPLDGSDRSEVALGVAVALAGPLVHELTLLRVVPTRNGIAPERAMQEADRYLADVSRRLAEQMTGQVMVETRVASGDPAEQILRRARSNCDLVIMATRGETGTRRWMFGSVADRVLHDSGTPLMLIHPEGREHPVVSAAESAGASLPGR